MQNKKEKNQLGNQLGRKGWEKKWVGKKK